MGKQIEGGFAPWQTVALVEAAGGKVARAPCSVDREQGARELLAERGVARDPLFNRSDLPV